MRARPLVLAPLLAALALAAGAARAQHGMPVGPRPLHLRLAQADVVAIATVAEVGEGRVEMRSATILRGEAPSRFEVKRAPSQALPYAVGITMLLPLRGARPPYVLVDDAKEATVLRTEAAARAWIAALPALLDAGDDPDALRAAYLGWLDGAEPSLREVAAASLLDPRSELVPVPPALAVTRALVALDPGAPTETRRAAAILAGARPEGARALLPALRDPHSDPQVAATALRGGAQFGVDGFDEGLLAALGHADRDVRLAAAHVAAEQGSPAVRARLAELAASDPDLDVRKQVRELLGEADDKGGDGASARATAEGTASEATDAAGR